MDLTFAKPGQSQGEGVAYFLKQSLAAPYTIAILDREGKIVPESYRRTVSTPGTAASDGSGRIGRLGKLRQQFRE